MMDVEVEKFMKVSISVFIDVKGTYKDNTLSLHDALPICYPEIYRLLQDYSVDIEIREASGAGWVSVLINASPFSMLHACSAVTVRHSLRARTKDQPRSY